MIQCAVVADDLTGANALGVLMTKINYNTYTITNPESFDISAFPECDCVIYPTGSRAFSANDAYNSVLYAVQKIKAPGVKLYSKRIDTTLRGNLGAETDAMLDALGGGRVAIIVPCFPSSGRINVGGYLLVNGVPLHKTEAAADPKTPVRTPLCHELYAAQSKYPVASVYISDLMKGDIYLAEKIRDLVERGVRNIIFDAVNEEDIDLIAGAAAASRVPFIAVDPGVFTTSLARKIAPALNPVIAGKKPPKKILVVVGSVNGVALRQVEVFLSSQECYNVYIETGEFLKGAAERQAEITRVADDILAHAVDQEVCSIIGHGIIPEFRVPFEPYLKEGGGSADDLSNLINDAIAEITFRILEGSKGFSALYTCGGDITVSVCRRIESSGLRLLDEVLPLASFGEVIGGKYEGLTVITKGGMVGDKNAIVTCVRYLKEKLSV